MNTLHPTTQFNTRPFGPVEINRATDAAKLDAVRDLVRAFREWQYVRHHEHSHFLDIYFEEHAFEADLASLPGLYAGPTGALLLAEIAGIPVGCIALKAFEPGVCEMKRLFVPEDWQGLGVGKALVRRLFEEARLLGYREMRLETGPEQHEAQGLYEALGFQPIEPYRPLPEDLAAWLICMSRRL